MIDYLIVGQGLAGSTFAISALRRNKSFKVINLNNRNASSYAAAGIFNPITGRKNVKTWLAEELFENLKPFYLYCEKLLQVSILEEKLIHKVFSDLKQQNDFHSKMNFSAYENFVFSNSNTEEFSPYVQKEYGAFEIKHAGYVKIPKLLDALREYLLNEELYIESGFSYDKLMAKENFYFYDDQEYRHVVFSEGYSVIKNPYFSWVPIEPTHGDILLVEVPGLVTDKILNKGFFMLPVEPERFVCGSTYVKTEDPSPTIKGRHILEEKLQSFLKMPFKIIDHWAGIRPAVKDRRPLVGEHPDKKNMYIFNGLGTKGVTLAPYFAKQLLDYIETSQAIHEEANIERYFSLYFESQKH